MARKTPQQIAKKWQRNATNAQGEYIEGVKGVEVSPTELAADNISKMQANYNARINDGTTEAALRGVSRTDWINATVTKGGARYAQGVTASQGKYERAMADLMPFIEALKAEIAGMPNVTEADAEARMLAWSRGMREYRRRQQG